MGQAIMPDNDLQKGAEEKPGPESEVSLAGQTPHRGPGPEVHGADTDFPEPGENPEHSGEPEEDPQGANQQQNPGHRQKRNQADKKDDPLAA